MSNQYFVNDPPPKLELDKNRFRIKECPCGKPNRDGKFVPFKGYEDKGYCHSCGETFLPELLKAGDWNTSLSQKYLNPEKVKKHLPVDFIPSEAFEMNLRRLTYLLAQNHFIQWLGCEKRGNYAFDRPTISKIVETYYVGNSDLFKYKGWVLFPYIDFEGNIRDVKAMDYDSLTGKRVKEPYNKVLFIGKEILNKQNANTVRCFFGEHLLKGNTMPVKLFESEATAIYASPFFSKSICIATGGNNGCRWIEFDKCNVLQGRNITLYPDLDAHESWELKAETLRGYGLKVQVSQLIKTSAIKFAKESGIDYLELVKLKYDLRDILKNKALVNFIEPEQLTYLVPDIGQLTGPERSERSEILTDGALSHLHDGENLILDNWDEVISELEIFFESATLPSVPLRLNRWSIILDVSKFIESHLANVKRNNGKVRFLPYLERLQELKSYLMKT